MSERLGELFRSYRKALILIAVVLGIGWIGFFDSHSLYKRARWHQEVNELQAENDMLKAEIERLESELEQELTDEEVERIAREEYGMQREGETVFPVRIDD